jgi:hypothetical protein
VKHNMTKRALFVGINDYPGTFNDLSGCVNDANDWAKLLRNDFGFSDNITMLINADATKEKILSALRDLVTSAKGGDVVVFTYAGHGSQVPDQGVLDESDNLDETLYVYDGKDIIDDEIRDIIRQIDRDAHLMVISDSCHSGGITREILKRAYESDREAAETALKPRYMPPRDKRVAEAVKGSRMPIRRRVLYPESEMPEVLLTGCNANESSYDAYIHGSHNGVMSAMAISLIKSNPKQTYRELHRKLREKLPSSRYPQSPQLEGSDVNKDRALFT